MKRAHENLRVERAGLYGEDYARAICNFDINLAFLRKAADDRVTTRSLEIPACGGFMLAERTREHSELFEEGKEAAFFGSERELHDKCEYYLEQEDERSRIAAAGMKRCTDSGYSNDAQLRHMLGIVQAMHRQGDSVRP